MKFETKVNKFPEINAGKADSAELSYWASVIEKTAKEICDDPECNKLEFKIDEDGNVRIGTKDNDALDCILKSFEQYKESIPIITQAILDSMIKKYQEQRDKSQSN